jgi:hypothetical protein
LKNHGDKLDFAAIGTVFNDATTKLVGGVTENNSDAVLKDLQVVQSSLEQLITKHPDQFQGEAAIHAQNIVDQIGLETQAIQSIGTDPYAAKYINDVQRDLIDIVQGDDQLAALATSHGKNGFAPVPDLLAPPAPFQGNAEQTAFMKQFVVDANDLGARAVTLAAQGVAPNAPETQQLVEDISAFVTNANTFTLEQGGLYSARFNNEFALEGVNGTASRALIHGLQNGDANEINAAANVLAANAGDVAGNMLGVGDTPAPTGSGIPDHVDSFAQAGAIFNDATTKLIGGVYDGVNNDGNRTSIVNDLTATRNGLSDLLTANPDQFQGASGQHVQKIISTLDKEITAVQTVGADGEGMNNINALHQKVINAVQNDPTLSAAATDGDVTGFTPLPSGKQAPQVASHFDNGWNHFDPGQAQDHQQIPHGHHSFEHMWG